MWNVKSSPTLVNNSPVTYHSVHVHFAYTLNRCPRYYVLFLEIAYSEPTFVKILDTVIALKACYDLDCVAIAVHL